MTEDWTRRLAEVCQLTINVLTADGSIPDDQLEDWARDLVTENRSALAAAEQANQESP